MSPNDANKYSNSKIIDYYHNKIFENANRGMLWVKKEILCFKLICCYIGEQSQQTKPTALRQTSN
jgi:hypothetical protein